MMDGRVRFSEIDHTRKITVPSIINYFSRLQYISVRRYRSRSGRTFKKEKSVDSDLLADRDQSLSENE